MLLNPYRYAAGGGVSPGAAAQSLLDHLISWWDFEQTTGTTFTDAHGTSPLTIAEVAITAMTSASGKLGRCLDLTGGSGYAYAAGAANDAFKFTTGQSFTLFLWVNAEAVDPGAGVNYHLMGRNFITSNQSYFLAITGSSTDSYVLYKSADGASGSGVTGVVFTPSAGWKLVAAGINAATNNAFIIINGVRTESALGSSALYNATSRFSLGREIGSGGTPSGSYPYHAPVKMDLAGVMNTAITDDEYAVLYNAGGGRTYADVVALAV